MRSEALARAHLAARNYGFAESMARQAVEQNPDQVPPLAALVEILHAVWQGQGCGRGLSPARAAGEVGRPRPARPAPARADRGPLDRSEELDPKQPRPRPRPATTGSSGDRMDLNTLGPLVWSPFPAEPLAGTDTTGRPWTLAEPQGPGQERAGSLLSGRQVPPLHAAAPALWQGLRGAPGTERRDHRRQHR